MNQEEMIRDVRKRLFEMQDIGIFKQDWFRLWRKKRSSVSGHRYSGNLQKNLEKQKDPKCS